MNIVQEIQGYRIYKICDNLISELQAEKKDFIAFQGNNIQEVIMGFDTLTKVEGLHFNSGLVKYNAASQEQEETKQPDTSLESNF